MLRRLLDGWPLVIVLVFIVAGCASRKPCVNYRYGDHIAAHFDPKHCRDIDQARWTCDGVIFDPQELKANAH